MTARDDKAWADYSEAFRRDALPKILSSGIFLSIHADGPDFDVQQATQIGAALLLGKPVVIVVPRGRTLPEGGLRRAADSVIEDWAPDPQASQQRLTDVLKQIRAI